ncbi:MAG: BLUF domain-containing protein [Rhodobacterales bacterium]
MFVQTIYDSRAIAHINQRDIDVLTAQSLPYNLKNGLTSFLYYDDWRFLQVIEGCPENVAAVMARIDRNRIHHNLKVRLMSRKSTRDFARWPFGSISQADTELHHVLKSMGLRDLFKTNVLEAIKILSRTAGRKYRTMSQMEKQALTDIDLLKPVEPDQISLTEDMLGLRH